MDRSVRPVRQQRPYGRGNLRLPVGPGFRRSACGLASALSFPRERAVRQRVSEVPAPSTAWADASRAMGTRKGEQDT